MKKSKIILVLSVVVIVLLGGGLYHFLKKDYPEDISHKMEKLFRESYKESTVPIKFYGQVLDQNSQPVKDADVSIKVTHYDSTQEFFENDKAIELMTDKDGKFNVSSKGRQISIIIEKAGYEYPYGVASVNFYNYGSTADPIHQPDRANPEVIRICKKTYPAYLTGSGPSKDEALWGNFDVTKDFETKFYITSGYYDVYGKDGLMPDGEKLLGHDESRTGDKDIQVSGSVPSANMYEVEFTPFVGNSALILSDERLEESPENGYVSSVTISVPTDSIADFKKYIYAKTADSSFYSRLDIEIMIGGRGSGRLIITSWTNPSSSRNLKYDYEYQRHEESWREKLSRFRYAATILKGTPRTRYLSKYDLGEAIGIKLDGTFDETLFQQEADTLKAQLKAEDPQWWHELE